MAQLAALAGSSHYVRSTIHDSTIMTETFFIVPAGSRVIWVLVGLVLTVMVGVSALLFAAARGQTASRFELSPAGLRLRGDLYGRLIPASDLRGDAARVVDLDMERSLAPVRRTNGTAVPGYQAGWFRLRNGERALLYLTDRHHAVYIPTRRDYSLLLSVQDPDRFLQRLRTVAARQ